MLETDKKADPKAARSARLFLAVFTVLVLSPPLAASPQDVASIDVAGSDAGQAPTPSIEKARSAILERERRQKATDLAALADDVRLSRSAVETLDEEIAALSNDRDDIQAAMIDAAAAQKAVSAELADTEQRTDALAIREGSIKASLRERRGVLAAVLAALERMGRKPPPALLVKPRDALGSVRSAILLGAVVPSIRDETAKLVVDLTELADVRDQIEVEKRRFAAQMTRHREEEARLARLFEEKQKLEASSLERRQAEAARASRLADKATNLEDLISSLQTDIDSARAAEEAARVAEAKAKAKAERLEAARLAAEHAAEAKRIAEERQQADRLEAERLERELAVADSRRDTGSAVETDEDSAESDVAFLDPSALGGAKDERLDEALPADAPQTDDGGVEVASLEPDEPPALASPAYDIATLRRETRRLAPDAAFSTMKGRLSKPVAGPILMGFGDEDDIGQTATGVSFAARQHDVVTAPADASVLYAGPFRSYGQLLILDAGGGYHVVLAGMEKIDVEPGQFVSAGEPVASMGAKRVASVAVAEFGAAKPALYVEFRRDGKPVDPSPWWIDEPSGRTRNDS